MSDREPRSRNSYHLDDDERFQPRVSSTPNVPPEALINQTRWVTFEAKVNISKEEANLISNSLKSSFGIGKEEAFNEVKVFLWLDGMNVSEMKNKIIEFQLNHNLEQDWKIWPQTYAEIFAEKNFPNAKDLSVNLEWRFLSDIDMKNYIQFFTYWNKMSTRYIELGAFIDNFKEAKWDEQRYTKFFNEFDSIIKEWKKSPEVKNAYKSIEGNPSWYRIGKWMVNWEIEFWDWMAMLAKHPLTFYAVAWWFLFWMFWTGSAFTKTFLRRFLVLAWWIVAWPIVRDASWFGEMIDDLIKKGNELWDDVSESNKRTEHKRKEAYNDWYNLWHNAAEGTRRFIEGIPAWVKEKYNWLQGETDNINSAFNERLNEFSQENSKNWQSDINKDIYIEQERFDTILPILASDKQFSNIKIEDLSNVKDVKSLKGKLDKETIDKIFSGLKPEETSKMNEDLLKFKKFIVNFASKKNWQGKKYETVWDVFAGDLTFVWAVQEWLREGNKYFYSDDDIDNLVRDSLKQIGDKNKKTQLMRMLSRGPLGNWDISKTYSNLKKVNTTGWNPSDKDILNQLISIYWWLELEKDIQSKLEKLSWDRTERLNSLTKLETWESGFNSKLENIPDKKTKLLFKGRVYNIYFEKRLEILSEEGNVSELLTSEQKGEKEILEKRKSFFEKVNEIPEPPDSIYISEYIHYIENNFDKYKFIYSYNTTFEDDYIKYKQEEVKNKFIIFKDNVKRLFDSNVEDINRLTKKIKEDSGLVNFSDKFEKEYKKELTGLLNNNFVTPESLNVKFEEINFEKIKTNEKWYKFSDIFRKINEIDLDSKLSTEKLNNAFNGLFDALMENQKDIKKEKTDQEEKERERIGNFKVSAVNIKYDQEIYENINKELKDSGISLEKLVAPNSDLTVKQLYDNVDLIVKELSLKKYDFKKAPNFITLINQLNNLFN